MGEIKVEKEGREMSIWPTKAVSRESAGMIGEELGCRRSGNSKIGVALASREAYISQRECQYYFVV